MSGTTTANGNGSVTFFTTQAAAAAQAINDVQNYATELATKPTAEGVAPLVVAGIIGAVATAVAAAATVAGVGVGIAALVKDEDGDPTQDVLEIEIVNSTSQSLIPYNYIPTKCDITEVAQPLLPTSSDSFLLTSGTVGRFNNDTTFELDFLIGSNGATSIKVLITIGYTGAGNPGRWGINMSIDGTSQNFAAQLQLMGAQFIGNANYPSFSLYISPIETTTGKMVITFYDTNQS